MIEEQVLRAIRAIHNGEAYALQLTNRDSSRDPNRWWMEDWWLRLQDYITFEQRVWAVKALDEFIPGENWPYDDRARPEA